MFSYVPKLTSKLFLNGLVIIDSCVTISQSLKTITTELKIIGVAYTRKSLYFYVAYFIVATESQIFQLFTLKYSDNLCQPVLLNEVFPCHYLLMKL